MAVATSHAEVARFLGIEASALELRFGSLPLSGQASRAPWPSGYWPDSLGGIARRWSHSTLSDAVYFPQPDAKAIRHWPAKKIATLSPAEKFDLLKGRYDFPTLQDVRGKVGFLVADWAGLCDGVALAAMTYPEPGPVTLKNVDGVAIPFASSDVKALLAYHVQHAKGRHVERLGRRCDAHEPENPGPECDDVPPDQFHLSLAHLVGLEKKALLADLTWDAMVWNHALFRYESRVLADAGAGTPVFAALPDKVRADASARGAARVVHVATRVSSNTFEVREHWEPGEVKQREQETSYQYHLFLDAEGRILGGRWRSYEKPDFLWRSSVPEAMDDAALARLLGASTRQVSR